MKKDKNIRQSTIEELTSALRKAKEEMSSHKLDFMQGKLKNTSVLTSTRKQIARIQTAIREKELYENA